MSTSRKQHSFHWIILLSILGGLALSACGPSIPRAQAEQEVGDTMLDYLVSERIGTATTYTRTAAQPWSNAPYEAGILVLAPARPGGEQQGVDYLDTDK